MALIRTGQDCEVVGTIPTAADSRLPQLVGRAGESGKSETLVILNDVLRAVPL